MPYVCRNMFEKHVNGHHWVDDLQVHAISNPEEAAQIAALKLVMNTNLREKLQLLDTEKKNQIEYWKAIINHKNMETELKKLIAARQPLMGKHIQSLISHPLAKDHERSK